jgi:hypothetical protein
MNENEGAVRALTLDGVAVIVDAVRIELGALVADPVNPL